MRQLKIRMPDDSIRSVTVDENQPVANLMVIICTKLGITDHDEYSLIATGKHTINGRRKERQDGRIIDQKMEQLKKKLKTDEDLAWVDHSKTLDEQEIHEQDVVLLRRKFFYSDYNIDTRDPLQLGLLYVQTRDAILSGTHPVTLDGACKFAGIQCQAQLGDFVEGRTTRPGYFNLKDYLPGDYNKTKNIERKIFAEHKKYYGLSELEAKARYISEARSLPTYGVTFFLVKEIAPGKNKLVPRLFGITKDCVMRVDADTKGILKTWPYTTVKRWVPSKNSLTLDFGDYSDSVYSVQTSEGEQISKLIAGYIDIILKRRKAKDHFGIEGDEGATMIEDSIAPSRATIIQNQPTSASRPPSTVGGSQLDLSSIIGPRVERTKLQQDPFVEAPEVKPAVEVKGKAEVGFESAPITQYVSNYELSLPQRDLQDRLDQAQDAVEEAQKALERPILSSQQSNQLINKSDPHNQSNNSMKELAAKRRKLSNQFAEINAATAQLVSLSAIPEEELNYPALNAAVDVVANSLPTVAKEVKVVAALMEDDESGERLVDAARRLCKAFSDLLNAAEPGPTVARQSLISAASRVGDATQALLYAIGEGADDEAEARADELLALAKSVASLAAALVLKAKDVASGCLHDVELRNLVIGSATQCALATSQMVATAKIVAPTINEPSCQRKLLDACNEVRRAVQGIQSACRRALKDDNLICQVDDAVERVNYALEELMEHVRQVKRTKQINTNTTTTSTTTTTTTTTNQTSNTTKNNFDSSSVKHHKIFTVNNENELEREDPNKSELVNQARHLARATAKLIQDIRPDEREITDRGRWRVDAAEHSSRAPERQYQDWHQTHQTNQTHQYQSSTSQNQSNVVYDEPPRERPVSMYESEEVHFKQTDNYDESSNQQQHQQQQQQQQPPEAAISGIVGDLDTTIMFATAGTLRATDDPEGYLVHRENVLRCAKALVEDTRPLVASAASDQLQLSQAAQESVFTLARLAETVKASAASLGPSNAESQVSLIRSVKDVAISLADLIGSTKSALGCDQNDTSRLSQVKDSAKGMVGSVTSLLKTVKSVEDEQQRGVRAIEAALETIENEINAFNSQCNDDLRQISPIGTPANGDELLRASRPVTLATAKTVHAGSSGAQDDAIVASNMGRKAIVDLLQTVRLVALGAEALELRSRIQESGRTCALHFRHLIELLHRIFQQPAVASANPEIKQELIGQSKILANCVNELTNCADLMRGLGGSSLGLNSNITRTTTTTTTTTTDQQLGSNWSNQNNDDPTIVAESELLGAASSIDAAARKLENLKPRVTSVKLPHEELNFDEIILDAAKSIIEATAALLRAASASQRELLVDGRLDETETFYASDNNQWSEGLISAARMVAGATHSLVEAANALVQGQASEERLISAAKQVASSTNQLLVACKVKADPDSKAMGRLSNAGQQVKRATDNLVRASQQAIEHDEEQSLIISNKKVSGIAQEISAREQILRKEKELQVAKTQLMAIRKAKYSNRPDDYQGYGGSLD